MYLHAYIKSLLMPFISEVNLVICRVWIYVRERTRRSCRFKGFLSKERKLFLEDQPFFLPIGGGGDIHYMYFSVTLVTEISMYTLTDEGA